MTDPLDQIARICAEAPEDALSRIADVLGFKEQQAEPTMGEEIHVNVSGGDVYTLPLQASGMDKPRFVVHVPQVQQAEPVGDALEFRVRDAIQGIANCIADPMWTGHAEVSKANLKRWHKALHDLLAAQSGQRAGVAEKDKDSVVVPRWLWDRMNAAPTQQQEQGE